jgi:hypothetical protein
MFVSKRGKIGILATTIRLIPSIKFEGNYSIE